MGKHGLIEEKMAKELLVNVFNSNGILARKSRGKEIDIWVKIGKGEYIAIQLSLNKNSILGSKGVKVIHRGVVPMWIDEKELRISFIEKNGNDKKIVQKIILLIKEVVRIFNLKTLKTSKEPNWKKL